MAATSPVWARLQISAKVACDLLIAAIALALLAPIMFLIALCVLIESPGPVFYRARRVGYRGVPIHILKFRKMHDGAAGPPLTLDADERFTRIGRWLARTKLDELPQLINVLKGDMSLVGPRPEDPQIVHGYREAFDVVLQVRPGITGLSQLAFAREAAILDPTNPLRHYEECILPQKLALDRLYAAVWSPLLDLQILGWTLLATLLRFPIAVNRATGRITVRRGLRSRITRAHHSVLAGWPMGEQTEGPGLHRESVFQPRLIRVRQASVAGLHTATAATAVQRPAAIGCAQTAEGRQSCSEHEGVDVSVGLSVNGGISEASCVMAANAAAMTAITSDDA